MERQKNHEKSQMLIYLSVAFGLPYILGILMGVGYSKGLDVSVFPSAQMFYPATAVILAAFLTRKGDYLIPKRFFIVFLIINLMLLICAVASIIMPEMNWNAISQYIMIFGSVIAWILLLTEKKISALLMDLGEEDGKHLHLLFYFI